MIYNLNDFLVLMQSKGCRPNDCVKVYNILNNCGVQQIQTREGEIEKLKAMPVATPAKIEHDGIVIIKRDIEKNVLAIYLKDEDFIEIVKALGFRWDWNNRHWKMEITKRTGTAENVIAELGNKLLNAGFSVRFETQELLEAAVKGDYQPKDDKWAAYLDTGYFDIKWGYEDKLLDVALTLPGAIKVSKYEVKVAERHYLAILDFIEQCQIQVTQTAQKRLDELVSGECAVKPHAPKTINRGMKELKRDFNLEDLKDE